MSWLEGLFLAGGLFLGLMIAQAVDAQDAQEIVWSPEDYVVTDQWTGEEVPADELESMDPRRLQRALDRGDLEVEDVSEDE